ncbi:MAG: methylated-DNA--[protein]-cysteine S-methyltransferase [Gluconacetobacter diazotrophicus]|nr:methylated-DNA--[protein]-cysteine S-methyltransferase [Gluconacetobacter diazotrophicus]
MPQLSLHSPLGALTLTEEDDAIVAIDWGWGSEQEETVLLGRTRDEIDAYFDGALRRFTVPMAPAGGTPYRRRVWDALREIPFGEVRTYAAIARVAGGSPRSVGQANSANPMPILIPCHRVVAGTGIGGFTGADGEDTKRFLLDLEREDGSGNGR